jgi:AcrR family transcriptional regulator
MPKVSDAHRRARRQQILRAAFTCFGREGFRDTTMRDICAEAELSSGAVYNYFDSKDDIIRALAEESRGSAATLFDRVDRDQPALQVLTALVRALGAFAEEPDDQASGGHRVRVRLWSEALREPTVQAVHRENWSDLAERLADVIRQGQQQGALADHWAPEALARVLVAFYQGMVLQKAIAPDRDTTPAFETLTALLQKGAP